MINYADPLERVEIGDPERERSMSRRRMRHQLATMRARWATMRAEWDRLVRVGTQRGYSPMWAAFEFGRMFGRCPPTAWIGEQTIREVER